MAGKSKQRNHIWKAILPGSYAGFCVLGASLQGHLSTQQRSVPEQRGDVPQGRGIASFNSSSLQLLTGVGARASGQTKGFSGCCYFMSNKIL